MEQKKKTYSPSGCSKVNEKAERKNKKLRNSVQNSTVQAELAENIWNFAIKQAFYIYTLIPHSGNKFLILNKVFYQKKVELKYFKNF